MLQLNVHTPQPKESACLNETEDLTGCGEARHGQTHTHTHTHIYTCVLRSCLLQKGHYSDTGEI